MNYKIVPIKARQALTKLAVTETRESHYEFVALRDGKTRTIDESDIELPCTVVFLPASNPWGWVVFVVVEEATVRRIETHPQQGEKT